MTHVAKIKPCLWFDTQAEEAANFYVSIFDDSRIIRVLRYGEAGFETHGKAAGSVMLVEFELDGQRFTALNGGAQFQFSEAISFEVACDSQEEVDYYWEELTSEGEEGPCGWLKDKYGLSWQIVPTKLTEMLANRNAAKVQKMTEVMLQMKKLDIARLKQAFEQG